MFIAIFLRCSLIILRNLGTGIRSRFRSAACLSRAFKIWYCVRGNCPEFGKFSSAVIFYSGQSVCDELWSFWFFFCFGGTKEKKNRSIYLSSPTFSLKRKLQREPSLTALPRCHHIRQPGTAKLTIVHTMPVPWRLTLPQQHR